ncbi:MAG: hypothetical protein Q9183_004610 [Haloplaca sp. 2 TL-2023]
MSRRAPNPAAERATQNQQTIKTLLKLEENKSCADCKRNKHPRWASWNLGIFVCIRKIENFIRTKYESKRWVMDGPMPDPSTLDAEGDDDVPLNVVQERARIERSTSQRGSSTPSQPNKPAPKPAPNIDLFGDIPTPPARPSTTDTPNARPPPPKEVAAPAKQQKQGDSLLGLDFFGAPPSAPSVRPSSATSTSAAAQASSRPDLKQSILSLYSSAPRAQPQAQTEGQDMFGGMQAPQSQQRSTSSGLDDAFSSLSFTSTTSPPPTQTRPTPNADPFASLSKPAASPSNFTSASAKPPPPLSGGGFFDLSTKAPPKPATVSKPVGQAPQPLRNPNTSNGLGDFDFASTAASNTKPSSAKSSNDLFDFSEPLPSQPAMPPKPAAPPSSNLNSAFNLSAPAAPSQPAAKLAPLAPTSSNAFSGFANDNPWGSDNAWANTEPSTAPKLTTQTKSSSIATTNDFSSWGNSASLSNFGGGNTSKPTPTIAADEDFGGWNSAAPVTPAVNSQPSQPTPQASKPTGGGFGASEDLFSNVWE